jgi:nucleoside-diphosphate-sugar epimerase
MVDAYLCILNSPKNKIAGQIFNVGSENYSVIELAEMVKKEVGEDVKLTVSETNDLRSYHISSEKILRELNFATTRSIRKASADLVKAFSNGLLPNSLEDERYFNIKKMQSIHLE